MSNTSNSKRKVTNTIAAIKRALKAAGHPLAQRSGRYANYGSTKVCTAGFQVTPTGLSPMVRIEWTMGYTPGSYPDFLPNARETRREMNAKVRALLEARGYVFDAPFGSMDPNDTLLITVSV
jgi:hypothetical protein